MGVIIMGGRFKGCKLGTDTRGELIRPTSGKVREALFSSLGERVVAATFLDLYSGSGAVGLEAVSRGAALAYLVDGPPQSFTLLKANCAILAGKFPETKARVFPVRAHAAGFCKEMREANRTFDVVFADPPFADDFTALKEIVLSLVSPSGVAVVQYPTRNPPAWAAEADKLRKYGESTLAFWNAETTVPE